MNNENSTNGKTNELPSEHARKFVEMLRSHYSQYHNHKETMAHAAVILQIGLFVGIMSMKHWPPKWIPDICCIPKEWFAFIGYILMWLLILLYVVWQLRRRNDARIRIYWQIDTLRKWAINSEPKTESRKRLEDLFGTLMTQRGPDKGPMFPEWLIYIASGLMLIMVFLRTAFS